MSFDEVHRVGTSRGAVAARVTGDGPPVVLLHGVFGDSRVWSPVASRLAERHRVLALDLLGFGHSDRPRDPEALWAPNQAAALREALDALGIQRAAVVGYDYGGPVGLTLSAQDPGRVAAMALTATNAFPDTPIPFPLSLLSLPVLGRMAERTLFSRPGLLFAARAAVGRPRIHLDADMVLGDRAQSAAVRTLFTRALLELPARYGPVEQALRSLRVPTLVVWGDRDPFFGLEQGRRTAEAVPGSRLEVYSGVGHFVPEEQPARFAADLDNLLAHVEAA